MAAFLCDAALDVKAVLCRRFLLVDAELDFNGRPFSVRHFDDGVNLPVVIVLIMVERGVERFRVAEEVAQDKALEEEAKRQKIAFEPSRRRLEKCDGEGRVAEVAFLCLFDTDA